VKTEMKSEIIEEAHKRKVYVVSDTTITICQTIAIISLGLGALLWWLIGFSWLWWICVGMYVAWGMAGKKHFMSERTLKERLKNNEV